MIQAHALFGDATRTMMALAVFVVGLWALISPDYFWGIRQYFKCSEGKLSPQERERLERTMAARQNAEGVPESYGRWLGVFGIAVAAFTFVYPVPFVVPYGLLCLAIAVLTILGYLQFRRATDRRVAPLLPRSALSALPLPAIVAMICCFVTTLTLAIYPPLRVGAIVGAVVTLVLGVIAWRIASAPALLLGIDPQAEYAVDERVRAGRATSIALLACAPAMVFVVLSTRSVPPQYSLHAVAAQSIVIVAFFVALVLAAIPLRRTISVA
jgi:hypothetical protein